MWAAMLAADGHDPSAGPDRGPRLMASAGRKLDSYDETDVRVRANPKGSRPRTKSRPGARGRGDRHGDHRRPRPLHLPGRPDKKKSAHRGRDDRARARAAADSGRRPGGPGRGPVRVAGRAGPDRAGRGAADRAAPHRRRHRPGGARAGGQRRPAGDRRLLHRPRAAAPDDRPLPGRRLRRRHGAAALPDQGGPGHSVGRGRGPGHVPAAGHPDSGLGERLGREGPRGAAGRPDLGAGRLLGRRQVDDGQQAGADRVPGHRPGERGDRARAAHLVLGAGAGAAGQGRRLGDRHARACARSGWRTWTSTG